MNKLNKFYPRKQLIDAVVNVFHTESVDSSKPQMLSMVPMGVLLASLALAQSSYAEEVKPTTKQNTKSNTESVADNNNDQTLPEVSVKAGSEPVQDGYQATKTRVGKVLQDPQDIPQAITTVTNSLMRDQQVGTLKEALRNVSGLTFNAAEGGRSGDNFMLRGFYTFGDIYLDGIRDTAQYNRETFNLEQVDVLRGSAAMLFGRGQAGGVINQVSKIPQLQDKNKITGSIGTDDYRQATGDFNKVIGETSAIRVNVMHRDEGSWRSNPVTGATPELHREGIAASLGLGLGTNDEFIFSHLYTSTRDKPDYGVPLNNGITRSATTRSPNTNNPITTYWGIDSNFDNSENNISTGTYTHKFSPDTQLRTQLRYADYQRTYWGITPSNTVLPLTTARNNGNQTRISEYKTTTLQSDLSTKFEAMGMKHEALTGVEYLHENSHRNTLLNIGTTAVPVYAPDVESTAAANNFKADNYAVYAQDTIEFIPNWKLLFGLRRDEMDANYTGAANAVNGGLSYGEWSYRSGLSWQPTESQHYYLSYSDSFSPTADLYQLSATTNPAERSQTTELGSKWLFMDGDLSLRTALYTTNKDWERNQDLEATTANAILTKKRRTDGLELEVAGKLTPNWEVFGGIALMDAKILEVAPGADPRFAGQKARNTADATLNLWTTYEVVENWKIGFGAEAKGERYGYSPTGSVATTSSQGTATAGPGVFSTGNFDPNRIPGYVRLDAMVAYEQKKWAVRLNVRNLLDKDYYDSFYDNGGFTVPGTRRAAILTTEYKF